MHSDCCRRTIGDSRPFDHRRERRKASLAVAEPGDAPARWQGVRLYLETASFERHGELPDPCRENTRNRAGSHSADKIVAAIRFQVTDIHPLMAPGA